MSFKTPSKTSSFSKAIQSQRKAKAEGRPIRRPSEIHLPDLDQPIKEQLNVRCLPGTREFLFDMAKGHGFTCRRPPGMSIGQLLDAIADGTFKLVKQ